MSEMKRVSFTTLSSTTSIPNFGARVGTATGVSGTIGGGALSTNASHFGVDILSGQTNPDGISASDANADRKNNKSMRLTIELFPTDSCKYPEFNYSRLLHLEKVNFLFQDKIIKEINYIYICIFNYIILSNAEEAEKIEAKNKWFH